MNLSAVCVPGLCARVRSLPPFYLTASCANVDSDARLRQDEKSCEKYTARTGFPRLLHMTFLHLGRRVLEDIGEVQIGEYDNAEFNKGEIKVCKYRHIEHLMHDGRLELI